MHGMGIGDLDGTGTTRMRMRWMYGLRRYTSSTIETNFFQNSPWMPLPLFQLSGILVSRLKLSPDAVDDETVSGQPVSGFS
jgi:hypothetical protein